MRHILTILAVVWLAACANTPAKVVLNPEVKGASTGIGAGQNVKLIVTGAAVDAPLLKGQSRFPLAQPATETVKSKMREGLLRHGFNVDDFGATDRQLTVNVLKANNVVTSGALHDTIQVEVSLELVATTNAGTLTRTINTSQMREVGGDASIGEVSSELNQSLGQALARALNDVELLQSLGK